MDSNTKILIAEDNDGHFALVKKNLRRTGIKNEIIHFIDGQEILDFLTGDNGISKDDIKQYVLLLDIRMPKVDGIEVLRNIKADETLKQLPVIMLTTTNNSTEINTCYDLGCSVYIVKPIEYANFSDALRKVGMFFSVLEVPRLNDVV